MLKLFVIRHGYHSSESSCHSDELTVFFSAAPSNSDTGQPYKDWVFINYTFKRFEGLTQRGPPMAKDVVQQK